MKHRARVMLIIFAGLALAGCGEQGERQFRQEKRQFAIVMKSKLNQFERRAAELSSQVQADSVRVQEIEELKGSHAELREQMAAINGATEQHWKEMKPSMEAAYYDLERRYYEVAAAVATQEAQLAVADTLQADTLQAPSEARGAARAATTPAPADTSGNGAEVKTR